MPELHAEKPSGTGGKAAGGAIAAVRGFKDILPPETARWQRVEQIATEIFHAFGFREIRVPILEKTELFRRGIGEATDIVEKEMYTFQDRSEDSLTLRPEATASVIRAYLEHGFPAVDPVARLYTLGPMFRRERPQKGRYRQFHQIDAEVLGLADPRVDAELLLLLLTFLRRAGLSALSLEVNSLGCPRCRPGFRLALQRFLAGQTKTLCPDCQRRLETNPLRIFDCKVETCRAAVAGAPRIPAFLCEACRSHFDTVQRYLALLGISFTVNPAMVRGLDYYVRTTFEVTTTALGAQNAVVGGGRYDGLIRDLGGPDIPGIGFAIGMERLISLLPAEDAAALPGPSLFLAALGEPAQERATLLANALRLQGIETELDYGGKGLKSQMKRSDRLACRFTLILGDRELGEGQAEMRDMVRKRQTRLPLDPEAIAAFVLRADANGPEADNGAPETEAGGAAQDR